MLGTGFAIIIAKQLYGGLGQNPFNPAMIGYVVLLISFPVQMTSWLPPYEIAATTPDMLDTLRMIFTGHTASGGDMTLLRIGIDGISRATPLDTFKTSLRAGHSVEQIMQYPIYSAALAGVGWQWVNLARLVGGVFLLWQKAIRWHIPVSFLLTLALCAALVGFSRPLRWPRRSFICCQAPPCWAHFYLNGSGYRLHDQPWTFNFRRAGWGISVADS